MFKWGITVIVFVMVVGVGYYYWIAPSVPKQVHTHSEMVDKTSSPPSSLPKDTIDKIEDVIPVKKIKALIVQTKEDLDKESVAEDNDTFSDEIGQMKDGLRKLRSEVVDTFENLVEDEAFFEADRAVQARIEKTRALIKKLDKKTGIDAKEVRVAIDQAMHQEVSGVRALEIEEKLIKADESLLKIEERIDILDTLVREKE